MLYLNYLKLLALLPVCSCKKSQVLTLNCQFCYYAPCFHKIGTPMRPRARVKICGITRIEDALACAQAGVDAIGLVFYQPSPRNVSVEKAQEIVAALPPFVSVVGLFVNASASELAGINAQVNLDMIQFHGDETPAFCASKSPKPWIK